MSPFKFTKVRRWPIRVLLMGLIGLLLFMPFGPQTTLVGMSLIGESKADLSTCSPYTPGCKVADNGECTGGQNVACYNIVDNSFIGCCTSAAVPELSHIALMLSLMASLPMLQLLRRKAYMEIK